MWVTSTLNSCQLPNQKQDPFNNYFFKQQTNLSKMLLHIVIEFFNLQHPKLHFCYFPAINENLRVSIASIRLDGTPNIQMGTDNSTRLLSVLRNSHKTISIHSKSQKVNHHPSHKFTENQNQTNKRTNIPSPKDRTLYHTNSSRALTSLED